MSRRLLGRDLEAADRRDPRADCGQTGTARADRLRVRAQWHGQHIHAVRASGRLAARRGDRSPHRRGLRALLKEVSDTWFPNAPKIALVQDNLSTHKPASLYVAFPAAEARRLAERFEWHYTPKHGSWLDLAESELGVLTSQCLSRRIADKQTLIDEIAAWEHNRNAKHAKANWHFTTADARIKLKRLYPSI